MMVKNEEHGIGRTIQSVLPAVDGGYFLDTGSTDRTDMRVLDTDIDAVFDYAPFIDFSSTRNLALARADQAYGKGAWLLMLSGDAVVSNAARLRTLAYEAEKLGKSAIRIPVRHGGQNSTQILLTMTGVGRYEGVTHEAMNVTAAELYDPKDAHGVVVVYPTGEDKTERWKLDTQLLSAELSPFEQGGRVHKAREVFYLAQSHECLGDYETALRFYVERVMYMNGFDEERFIAALRVARCAWRLGRPEAQIEGAYLFAASLAPARAEPLYELAKYHAEANRWREAWPWISRAVELPYPKESILFVDAPVYERLAPTLFEFVKSKLLVEQAAQSALA